MPSKKDTAKSLGDGWRREPEPAEELSPTFFKSLPDLNPTTGWARIERIYKRAGQFRWLMERDPSNVPKADKGAVAKYFPTRPDNGMKRNQDRRNPFSKFADALMLALTRKRSDDAIDAMVNEAKTNEKAYVEWEFPYRKEYFREGRERDREIAPPYRRRLVYLQLLVQLRKDKNVRAVREARVNHYLQTKGEAARLRLLDFYRARAVEGQRIVAPLLYELLGGFWWEAHVRLLRQTFIANNKMEETQCEMEFFLEETMKSSDRLSGTPRSENKEERHWRLLAHRIYTDIVAKTESQEGSGGALNQAAGGAGGDGGLQTGDEDGSVGALTQAGGGEPHAGGNGVLQTENQEGSVGALNQAGGCEPHAGGNGGFQTKGEEVSFKAGEAHVGDDGGMQTEGEERSVGALSQAGAGELHAGGNGGLETENEDGNVGALNEPDDGERDETNDRDGAMEVDEEVSTGDDGENAMGNTAEPHGRGTKRSRDEDGDMELVHNTEITVDGVYPSDEEDDDAIHVLGSRTLTADERKEFVADEDRPNKQRRFKSSAKASRDVVGKPKNLMEQNVTDLVKHKLCELEPDLEVGTQCISERGIRKFRDLSGKGFRVDNAWHQPVADRQGFMENKCLAEVIAAPSQVQGYMYKWCTRIGLDPNSDAVDTRVGIFVVDHEALTINDIKYLRWLCERSHVGGVHFFEVASKEKVVRVSILKELGDKVMYHKAYEIDKEGITGSWRHVPTEAKERRVSGKRSTRVSISELV